MLPLIAASCDEGRLYDASEPARSEGAIVMAVGRISGAGQWSDGYSLVLAGYGDSEYAEISKAVTGDTIILSGIPAEATIIELGAINRLRQRVATFASAEIDHADGDTIKWDLGAINCSLHAAIQANVLNTTCANCHGAANYAAAGLYLTADKSYDALVGKPSAKMPGMMLVEPGNPDGSVAYRILTSEESRPWAYDHSAEVTDHTQLELIKLWISCGAPK